MTSDHDAKLIADELSCVSPDVDYISAYSIKPDGIQPFHFWTTRLLTTEEMVSVCRDMAAVIRRYMPERPDGWAAAILAANDLPARIMGTYYVGWTGHSDEWHLKAGRERKATDHADWLAFRNRLRAAVAALGTEGERSGDGSDFHVSDGEDSPLEQTLFVHSPEFLTKELITAIQNVVRDGSANEVIEVVAAFGEPFRSIWDGLEVRADGIIEKWDRQEAERLLGDRLKIPRYARDDS